MASGFPAWAVVVLCAACLCGAAAGAGMSVVATLDLPYNGVQDLFQQGCVDSVENKGYVTLSSETSPFLYRFTLDPLSFPAEDKTFVVPSVQVSSGVLCDSVRGVFYNYGRSAAVPGVGSFATIESVDIRNGTTFGVLSSYSTICSNEAGFVSAFVEPKKGHVFTNCLEDQGNKADLYELDLSTKDPELVHDANMTPFDGSGSTFVFSAVLCKGGSVGVCTEDSSVSILMATVGSYDKRPFDRAPAALPEHGRPLQEGLPRSTALPEPAETVAATPSPSGSTSVRPEPTSSATPTGGTLDLHPLAATFRNFYPWPLDDFARFGESTSRTLQFTTCANNTRPVALLRTCEGQCADSSPAVLTLQVLDADLAVTLDVFLTGLPTAPEETALACVGRQTAAVASVDNVLFYIDLQTGDVQVLPLTQYETLEWLACDLSARYAYAGAATYDPTTNSGVLLQIELPS